MTIDQGIQLCEYNAKTNEILMKRYDDASGYTRSGNAEIRTTDAKTHEKYAEEHRQLAAWLRELKERREQTSDDCISRKDAIYLASELKDDLPDDERLADMTMAHNEGILDYQTKLSLLSSVQPDIRTSDDCISRQAVLDLAKKGILISNGNYESVCKAINEIPSAQPKTGHWIDVFGGCECSKCGCLEGGYSDYCPNCGCRMVEPPERSEE